MDLSFRLLLSLIWAASQTLMVDTGASNALDHWKQVLNSPTPQEPKAFGPGPVCPCANRPFAPSPDPCSYCASLQCNNPNNLPLLPGGVSNQGIIEECRSCSDPFTRDCFCTGKYHPRGCTIRDCGPNDGTFTPDYPDELSVVGYTCYCSDAFRPSDCVSRSNPKNPRCEPTTLGDGTYRDYCQCDTETSDPDNCNIRVCDPDELTGDGYHCLCGPRCDQRPDGCAKELPLQATPIPLKEIA